MHQPPDPVTGMAEKDLYVFEKDAILVHAGKPSTVGKIDLYRHQKFILEAKQGSDAGSKKHGTAKRGTAAWAVAMKDAYGQALQYARTLDEPPPFLIATDIGYCFDLYAVFDGSLDYRPFPSAQSNRIFLSDLAKHLDLFRKVWTEPGSLDPSKVSARVTRDVAARLAELAKSLEKSGHAPDAVATFLMRCLFTMFSEDVQLLSDKLFQEALRKHWLPNPNAFPSGIESLWRAMNEGTSFGFIGKLLKFNGGLFAQPNALPLNKQQLQLLLDAAECDWADVEPAIFGTLLERALDPKERHKLGAHFTPRAYVERLVKPAIEEPLRAEWDLVRAEVRRLVGEERPSSVKKRPKKAATETRNLKDARKAVLDFHKRLCAINVLDPACGSGNFLYVTLDLFKKLESEVFALLADLGDTQYRLELQTVTVSPRQFLGIEIKRWAKEIAELVLWIGFLQHHYRTRKNADGTVKWPEPVLENLHNIECRDAVLAWDGNPELVRDEKTGKPLARWDGVTYRTQAVTGEAVPDEKAKVPDYRYNNPRKAVWPKADYVIGNPPFIGNKMMRQGLGSGYVEALRRAHNEVPETCDLVMYWWNHAADLLRKGHIQRFGLITTKAITQTFNRRVVQHHVDAEDGISLVFAIPNHPWVESEDGAAVRIAVSVARRGEHEGILATVIQEQTDETDALAVELATRRGIINADLTVGLDTRRCTPLAANRPLCLQGCKLVGEGFQITPAKRLEWVSAQPDAAKFLPRYVSGSDITKIPNERYVIDFFGIDSHERARECFPAGYQIVFDRVKPEREQNRRDTRRNNWWLFGENAPKLRRATEGLKRFIATSEVAKHRVFVFYGLPGTLADGSLAVIAHDDAFVLGVLSSRVHVTWALHAGGRMGVGNDPRYQNGPCFDPFPFPECSEMLKTRIRALGESLDAHRKSQQSQHRELTITGMYNVLAKLRSGELLIDKEREIHDKGLLTVLRGIHDDLDAAVFAAYDWPVDLTDEQILERLVTTNAKRAEEERNGLIRWLRPDFQNPTGKSATRVETEADASQAAAEAEVDVPIVSAVMPWPKKMAEQITTVRELMRRSGSAWTVEQVAAGYKGARRDDVEDVLNSLAALGLLVAYETADGRRWRDVG
jgi:hypothetical protein